MNFTTIVGASNEGKDSWYQDILQLMPSLVYPEMHKILNWLHKDLPDPSTTHNRLVDEHHEGTGEWFLHSKMFKRWKETPGGMLWIKGIRMFSVMLSIVTLSAHR
jgi:hypothetical protein